MFFDDHKKAITTMMAKRNAKGEKISGPVPMKAEVVKKEDGEVDGRHVASQDMMAAFHEKSPERLMHALSNFVDIHNSMPSQAGKESEGSDQ